MTESTLVGAEALLSPLGEEIVLFIEHLAFERHRSDATIHAYGSDLRQIALAAYQVGIKRTEDLTTIFLRQYFANMTQKQRLGPRSVARKQSALRSYFSWAIKSRKAPLVDPTAWLVPPEKAPLIPKPLRLPSVMSVMTYSENKLAAKDALRDYAALLLLYGAGLRRGEVLRLKLADSDLKNRWVKIEGKGRKMREVPLPKGCVPGLLAYLESRQDNTNPYFLAGRQHAPLGERTLARIVERAAKAALGAHATPHQLRHSFATHLLQHGAGLKAIQQLLGHAQIISTQPYTEVPLERLAGVLQNSHPRQA